MTFLLTALSRLSVRRPPATIGCVLWNQARAASGGEIQFVSRLSLNNISDNPGAKKKGRRVGRGVGSSKGKTCGRGHKGQNSRSGGGVRPTFEGGQTPYFKTLPKRGFTNPNAMPMLPINLGTLQDYVDMGRLDPSKEITLKSMVDAGMTKINSIKHGIKLLAKGKERLRTPLAIKVSRASEQAISAVEEVGGEITTVHYNKLALRALLRPHKFDVIPRQARPPPRLMEYYIDWNKRGYLSPQAEMRKVLKGKKLEEAATTG